MIENPSTCVNKILPHQEKWAWDLFLKSSSNNWNPSDISMQRDIQQWKSKDFFSDDEKLLIKRSLGFFASSESLVGNNLLMTAFRYLNQGEIRQFLMRQCLEEAIHNWTIVYVCDSLRLDYDEIYNAYNSIPAIKAKDDFLASCTTDLSRQGFDANTDEGKLEVIKNLIRYYMICEGLFFYSGFAMLLSFGRQNKIPGICEQINYSLRDEGNHILFGSTVINRLREIYPHLFDASLTRYVHDLFNKAVELELLYVKDVLPRGLLGLNYEMFNGYVKYLANRRLESIMLPRLFALNEAKNPFSWLSEVIEIQKNKNFFETRVIEYQTSTIVDDL